MLSFKFRNELTKFLLVYTFTMVLFIFFISYEPLRKIIDINGFYTKMVVSIVAEILKPLGIVLGTKGSIIYLKKNYALNVLFGCNGLEAFLIYTAGVIAFKSAWYLKIKGIFVGFILLQLFNILRIAALALVYVYFKNYFYYFHIYVAQGITVAFAFILFLGYLHYATRKT